LPTLSAQLTCDSSKNASIAPPNRSRSDSSHKEMLRRFSPAHPTAAKGSPQPSVRKRRAAMRKDNAGQRHAERVCEKQSAWKHKNRAARSIECTY
jgi:hypothetical protein